MEGRAMDLLKAQWARVQQQLVGLTISQKMLTASLVAVMVMTLLYWSRYAGEPEMVPVLNQSMTSDQLAQIDLKLTANGIAHRIEGDRVMVPADRKLEAFVQLDYDHVLPTDFHDAF